MEMQALLQRYEPPEQEMQFPFEQIFSVPHGIPSGALPLSVHSEAPLLQVVFPVLQGAGWQVMFAVHATQAPLLQTFPWPQFFPSGALPISLHSVVPVAHEDTPTLHGLGVVHETSGVQGAQFPLLQKRLLPQPLPFGAFLLLSVQAAAPLAHDNVPV
jgi:hypothetical protein